MKRTLLLVNAFAVLCAALFAPSTSAQVRISAGTYTQNFNSLANSGADNSWVDGSTLPGWYASTNKSASARGPITVYRADTGSSTAGALYSYGAALASDRALGSLSSGTPGNLAYGVRFLNDLAEAVTSITISYTGEQWRNSGTTAVQTLTFSYRISDTAITTSDAANTNTWTPCTDLDFNSPMVGSPVGALDGNAAVNRQAFTAVPLTGVTVLSGQEIFLRWYDINDAGNDHGLAIDDLTVTFNDSVIVTRPPTIAPGGQPQSRTNNAGTIATFSVTADGSEPLYYQWRKDGTDLSDTDHIIGSSSATLTLSNVFAADAGNYDVVIVNSENAATSVEATLTVIDPVIHRQPVGRSALAGETATFSIGAAGTPPVSYQWLLGGSPIADATSSALRLTDVQAADQGDYACVFTGSLGVLTSAVAVLTVTTPPSATLALWDFNDTNAPLTSPSPSIGAGTALLLNGVTPTFAAGVSSDPGDLNRAWNTAAYAPQGASNKLSGVQFNVSTEGYQDILLAWQERHSNTASKYTRLQYSTDGTTFIDGDVFTMLSTDNSFVFYTSSLASLPGVNNNPNFAFRVVSEWEATAVGNNNSNYVGTVGSYASSGTVRFDLVNVYANPFSASTLAPTTLRQIIGTTLTYDGGAGSQFVLLKSSNPAAPLSGWIRVHTNFATPGTFTVPTGSEAAAFYRIKSE